MLQTPPRGNWMEHLPEGMESFLLQGGKVATGDLKSVLALEGPQEVDPAIIESDC